MGPISKKNLLEICVEKTSSLFSGGFRPRSVLLVFGNCFCCLGNKLRFVWMGSPSIGAFGPDELILLLMDRFRHYQIPIFNPISHTAGS